jgi:hypothetical protein
VSAYLYVRVRDVLAVQVGAVAVARVVGMGSNDPTLEVRDAKGRWVGGTSIDDAHARIYLREYAELALFVLANGAKSR